MLEYTIKNCNINKTTLKMELDIKKILTYLALDRIQAEKEVLKTIRAFDRMQFMGLKDKNGSLIYFGDILIDEYFNLLTPVCEVSNGEHILFFKPLKHLNKNFGIGCKSTYSTTLEVVGNIYQNSELFAGVQEKDRLMNLLLSAKNCVSIKTVIQVEVNNTVYTKV